MLIVGITGRSGSGKSTLTAYYAMRGYPVLDGDALSREITAPNSPCLNDLAQAFGSEILANDGTLLRRKLADIAFSLPNSAQKLNEITHPYLMRETASRTKAAKQAGAALFFIDGAAIVGGIFEEYCDKIIVVTAEKKLSISRIILRDGISKAAVATRLAAQLPEEAMTAAASYIIQNNAGKEALHAQANEVLQALLSKAN